MGDVLEIVKAQSGQFASAPAAVIWKLASTWTASGCEMMPTVPRLVRRDADRTPPGCVVAPTVPRLRAERWRLGCTWLRGQAEQHALGCAGGRSLYGGDAGNVAPSRRGLPIRPRPSPCLAGSWCAARRGHRRRHGHRHGEGRRADRRPRRGSSPLLGRAPFALRRSLWLVQRHQFVRKIGVESVGFHARRRPDRRDLSAGDARERQFSREVLRIPVPPGLSHLYPPSSSTRQGLSGGSST